MRGVCVEKRKNGVEKMFETVLNSGLLHISDLYTSWIMWFNERYLYNLLGILQSFV